MPLTKYEQETIINFNKGDKMATIFTYEESWQRHLEKKLGLKPTLVNGFGGRGYEIDKRRIRPPRPVRTISDRTRKALANARLKRQSPVAATKSRPKHSKT